MTNEEQYTIDTTPFRVKVDEPAPGPNGHPLRKWNALNMNIDRYKTMWSGEYDDDGVQVEYLYPQSHDKVWAVCIQCGKGRWTKYRDYRDLCKSCSHSGEMCSEETRKKMSDARSGEKSYMYGKPKSEEIRKKISCTHQGITLEEFHGFKRKEYMIFRASVEYANWRIAVFERDNYTCQECGAHNGGDLQAHHITPFHLHPEPEYSLTTDNGITLCETCHDKVRGHEDEFYNKYTAIVKANCGFKDDFLSSSVILEGLKKQNDPHLIHQPTLFDY
jgi:hypothetical protein